MQQRLLDRSRAVGRLRSLSDHLLVQLLAQSDPLPERVPPGVILFRQGERVQGWYLLLSGQIQLFLDGRQGSLAVLGPGSLFGELQPISPGGGHSCGARVFGSPAEFVRLGQAHFLALYNKWADQLQPCMLAVEDVVAGAGQQPENGVQQGKEDSSLAGERSLQRRAEEHWIRTPNPQQQKMAESAPLQTKTAQSKRTTTFTNNRRQRERAHGGELTPGLGPVLQLLEMDGPEGARHQALNGAAQLGRALTLRSGQLMAGSELCSRIRALWAHYLRQQPRPLTPLAIGQTLLESALLVPLRADWPQFLDSQCSVYRWAADGHQPENEDETEAGEQSQQLTDSLVALANAGWNSLLQLALRKEPAQRTDEELEMLNEELSHIRAFSHLSRAMKLGLARVVHWQGAEHAGSVVFREGEPGDSWFVVLRGELEARMDSRKSLLREGDDFGKLALLASASGKGQQQGIRQSTVVTTRDGCQLLRVNAHDFQRVLKTVEENTVRLRQSPQGEDLLVLQRDPSSGSGHSLVAGLPEKVLEYVLETRVEFGPEKGGLLHELLLTHLLWMPSSRLCDALKLYYSLGPHWLDRSAGMASHPDSAMLTAKQKTVLFVLGWHRLLGARLFLDPVANSFVEELFSELAEDARRQPQLEPTLARMERLMGHRETAMQRLSRAPRLVLDCGAYSSDAPAPSPVLACDVCNQPVLLPDSSQLTLRLRLDQGAAEIAAQARLGRQPQGAEEQQQCQLVELRQGGNQLPFAGTECSVPTMLSPGSRLLAVLRSDREVLPPEPEPFSVRPSLVLLLGPERLARAFALFHFKLLAATHETELLVHLAGREKFSPRLAPSNLDLLLRRFAQLQFWASSEVLSASNSSQRLAVLSGLIQLIQRAKSQKDLLAMSSLSLGLSALPVSRLSFLWAELPPRSRLRLARCQALLAPGGLGHRSHRMLVQSLCPPFVPFVPLLLKELAFVQAGQPSQLSEGLLNWEKMHLTAKLVAQFRSAKGEPDALDSLIEELAQLEQTRVDEGMARNLPALEDQARLMELSLAVQPEAR